MGVRIMWYGQTFDADLRRSASAVYPKASTRGILIEQNLILCERGRTEGALGDPLGGPRHQSVTVTTTAMGL